MDVLSDVLQVIRLSGAVFFTAEFSSPWALESPDPGLLASVVLPDAECLSFFHVLMEGECWVDCPDDSQVHMKSGDVIIFPHGHAHTMCSQPGVRPAPIRNILPAGPRDELLRISYGGGGKKSRFLCGFLSCDQRFTPLMGALPNILLVRNDETYSATEAASQDRRRPAGTKSSAQAWLKTTLRYAVDEATASRPGKVAILARLTELMFMEVLRGYMHRLPAGETGWFAGLKDPYVGKALRLMHAQPARRWTVTQLAREAATSRSLLAQRFTELLGEAPMHYLAAWRVQLARHMLRDGTDTIPEIAGRVGYESEAAFSRAFKRLVGESPSAWGRGGARGGEAPSPDLNRPPRPGRENRRAAR